MLKDYRYLVLAAIACLAIMMTGGVTDRTQPLLARGAIGPAGSRIISEIPGDGSATGSNRNGLPWSNIFLGVKNGSLGYPLPKYYPISSGFGMRFHPIESKQRFHYGIDIAAPYGTPVLATGHGQVISSKWDGAYGNFVLLQHEAPPQQTFYAHLSKIAVDTGQWVEQGTIMGYVGSTGYSTGPHLHYEILEPNGGSWEPIDPEKLLGVPGAPPEPQPAPLPGRRRGREPCNNQPWAPCRQKPQPAPLPGRRNQREPCNNQPWGPCRQRVSQPENDREIQEVFGINEFNFHQGLPKPWDRISSEGS